VALLSLVGMVLGGLVFLFTTGMSGFGAGHSNSLVVFTLFTPVLFCLLCLLCAGRRFGPFWLRIVMLAVVLLTLPQFHFLWLNRPSGLPWAGALLVFLGLWFWMCRRQLVEYDLED
jgi:hypothetical protein